MESTLCVKNIYKNFLPVFSKIDLLLIIEGQKLSFIVSTSSKLGVVAGSSL